MPLSEHRRFNRPTQALRDDAVRQALMAHRSTLVGSPWVHCGYASLPAIAGLRAPVIDLDTTVDGAFRLVLELGFETAPIVVTTGLRSSRFASILFWEVLHALMAGGVWIDIDEASRCVSSPNGFDDYPHREYFRLCLASQSVERHGSLLVQTFRKTHPTTIAPHIDDCGWTFGILTAGQSAHAARMAAAILDLDLPNVEVIFCGPRPAGAPHDARVSAIDLGAPEPRGWITRKKNLIADRARYDNLCLLHDRYVITREWADAFASYGPCYSVTTFPQVYYAGADGQFPQRYPDYQLLAQSQGVERALATRVYDADRVFHPAYDDFSETAFCCGGLYIARRSLWNLVRQDEALYHCEWEDISFGLECQRRGIPHRINPFVVAESTAAHPLLLTRLHTIQPSGEIERAHLHVKEEHARAASSNPSVFKPVFARNRHDYYEAIRGRFNAIDGLPRERRLAADFATGCTGLADVWAAIERHVSSLPLTRREEIAQIAYFVSDIVYKWPAPHVQSWISRHEQVLAKPASLHRFSTVVGWGTGSAFREHHRLIGRDLAYVIDNDPAKWGRTIDGVIARPPSALRTLAGEQSAVVVFSCYYDEIAAGLRNECPDLAVVPYHAAIESRRFQPLVDLIGYYSEVERYYPRLFAAQQMELAA